MTAASQILPLDALRSFFQGLHELREADKGIEIRRFPESINRYYQDVEHYRYCAACTPGVCLEFVSDCTALTVQGLVRTVYPLSLCFDLYIDDRFVQSVSPIETSSEVLVDHHEPFQANFAWTNDDGHAQRVRLYFPHLGSLYLHEVGISAGAKVESSPASPTWLAIGDSNTQGGTSFHPSQIYSAVAARALGLCLHNAGVGGMKCEPGSIVEEIGGRSPAFITVAYGTNDWSGNWALSNAEAYLDQLRSVYPEQTIYVLSPIYRTEADSEAIKNKIGLTLSAYRAGLEEIVRAQSNVHWVPHERLLPAHPVMLHDGLHPTTHGHQVYGSNLAAYLKVHEG